MVAVPQAQRHEPGRQPKVAYHGPQHLVDGLLHTRVVHLRSRRPHGSGPYPGQGDGTSLAVLLVPQAEPVAMHAGDGPGLVVLDRPPRHHVVPRLEEAGQLVPCR